MSNKYLSLFLSALLFFLFGIANAQTVIPENIIGNWINEKNNNWDYGFFEKFAIYDNQFWEYEDVHTEKSFLVIKLKKGTQTENLRIKTTKNNTALTITANKAKPAKYKLNQPGFFPYRTTDETSFKNSNFRSDTVTIVGYYRNLDKFLKNAEGERQKGPFNVAVADIIMDEEVRYYADFDSLGRFTIKFPVRNTQEVYLDWRRLHRQDVVEPGEAIFLFADMADFIPKEPVKSWEEFAAFHDKPKQIIYMGRGARLHNELANYNASNEHFDSKEAVKKVDSDIEFLNAAKFSYNNRVRHLEDYSKSKPTLSKRFKEYQYAYEKYQLAFALMQHRFEKVRNSEPQFEKGYMEFVDSLVDFNDEKLFTLVREYSTVIRDYTDYYKDLRIHKDKNFGSFSVNDADVLNDLKDKVTFSKQEEETIAKFSEWIKIDFSQQQEPKDSARLGELSKTFSNIVEEFNGIMNRLGIRDSIGEMRSRLLQKKVRIAELKHVDTLIQNKTLKELLIARVFFRAMDNNSVPLSATDLQILDESISIQSIKDFILETNNHYVKLTKKEVPYLSSLKNTDHLKESKDADSLFRELIAPYKGKVIYLDFWGTWCGPCRQQMAHVGDVKEELRGKDVIFMYLANNSSETSWKNVIKEMNLTGENVVHYRLPDAQQAMIERRLSINHYPTYMLIDRNGELVRDDAPRPQMKEELISAIDLLLKD